MHAGQTQRLLNRAGLADDVDHGAPRADGTRAAQRKTDQRAHMVLELAGVGPLDAPVAGIVHPGRHLVGHQSVGGVEQLQRQHAHIVEPFHQPAQVALRRLFRVGIHIFRRRAGQPQNALVMHILHQRPEHHLPVPSTGGQHGQLPLEGHEPLHDQLPSAQCPPRLRHLHRRLQAILSLAVIAAGGGLGNGRQPDFPHRLRQRRLAVNHAERRRRNAQLAEQRLFPPAVLAVVEGVPPGQHRYASGFDGVHHGRIGVLALVGDHIGPVDQLLQSVHLIVMGEHVPQHGGGFVLREAVETELLPQRIAGHGEHAAQLAGTENADIAGNGRHGCS